MKIKVNKAGPPGVSGDVGIKGPPGVSVVGDIRLSVLSEDHNGWLVCDGRELSRTTYPNLFQVLGTAFNTTAGPTTFQIPDARGRALGAMGLGSGLTERSMGAYVGVDSLSLQSSNLPAHTHTHAGGLSLSNKDTPYNWEDGSIQTMDGVGPINSLDEEGTIKSTTTTGGGQTISLFQPTVFLGSLFVYSG